MNIELWSEILSYWAFISIPVVIVLIILLVRKK